MKNITKRIISMILTVTLLFCATVPVFADDYEDEEYLSDLRIVYADDYDEATEILEDSGLEGYKLLDANLNENTGKKGVFLVYKTTTDVEDAITDIAIMQMNGGYKEGNYQEMIAESYQEYLKMGENYLEAIDYFKKAYAADNYLAKLAYRQLNFYNVVTEGVEEIPDFEGERIGDIFLDGISASDLATMFMEGNVYALSNLRSLLAMGVSYNEDGMAYLDKVAVEAEKYTADKTIYNNEDYRDLATMVSHNIVIFRDMFKELEAHKDELNYDDDAELTELEFAYMEHTLLYEMMDSTSYIDGKTLYDFCKNYTPSQNDNSDLYPLVAALNEGQIAMTKVAHYYDVVRYSMTLEASEELEAELAAAEEEYGELPFNVYEGVDRTIYRGTFALTSEAYRADAFTEEGLLAALFRDESSQINLAAEVTGKMGVAIFALGLLKHGYHKIPVWKAMIARSFARSKAFDWISQVGPQAALRGDELLGITEHMSYTEHYKLMFENAGFKLPGSFDSMSFEKQFDTLEKVFLANKEQLQSATNFGDFKDMVHETLIENTGYKRTTMSQYKAMVSAKAGMNTVYALYLVGGLVMLASAITYGYSVWNYYHPDYDDIPTALVDLIDTVDGDRYIKYDVVYEAEEKDGQLVAADLNAFAANRWNAMYYTKSYEAGKPLLADEFVVSYNNNVPEEGYAPVHRFGEVVSYNLNKYNFNDDFSIYLSVKQSENQKSAVADVPELVGSMFGRGFLAIAGVVGLVAGVGGTLGAQEIAKKRKSKRGVSEEPTEDIHNT